MQEEIFPLMVSRLGSEEPLTEGSRRAAVSVILSSKDAPKTLLIRRAERSGDPWSGQVAFPGGKSQETDRSVKDTAVRETMEEVGVDLGASSEFLGYFRHFRTHTGDMDVVPALFLLKGDVQVRMNEEVTSYTWVDLKGLLSDATRSTHRLNFGGEATEVPAFKVGEYVIWGLTHRIISTLIAEESV